MGVHGSADLSSGFHLDPFCPCLDCILSINPLDDKIRMAVEVLVLCENPRVLCEARSDHIGEHTRHDCRAQHIIKSSKPFLREMRIYIIEKIINVLHRHLEVLQPQLIWKARSVVEFLRVNRVAYYLHTQMILRHFQPKAL